MTAQEIIQSIMDIVFSRFFLYMAPIVFVFMVIMFSDRLIDLLFYSISEKRNRWR